MSHLLMVKVLTSLPAEGGSRLNGPEWASDKDQFTKMAAYFSSTACILGWLKWKQLSGTWRFPVSLSSWFKMGTRISLQKWLLTAPPRHCAHPLYDPIPPYYLAGSGTQTDGRSIVRATKLWSPIKTKSPTRPSVDQVRVTSKDYNHFQQKFRNSCTNVFYGVSKNTLNGCHRNVDCNSRL